MTAKERKVVRSVTLAPSLIAKVEARIKEANKSSIAEVNFSNYVAEALRKMVK